MTVSASTPPLQFNSPQTVLNALRGHGLRISTARFTHFPIVRLCAECAGGSE
jgi:hypothetical protein